MWEILAPIFLILLGGLAYYIFYVPYKFVNFELKDRRLLVNAKKRRRIYNGSQIISPYPNGWFPLEESINLKPGTSKSIDCLGENFLIFRSSTTNEAFVLDTYCPHMGANIGMGGMVRGSCVECPFHQWKFSGETGECVDIPYSESCGDIKKQASLKKWISKEENGFIFVWYHAENEEPWKLPIVDLSNLRMQYSSEIIIHAHIQEVFENVADQAHLKTVHGASIFAGKRPYESNLPTVITQLVTSKWSANPKNFFQSKAETNFYFKLFDKYDIYEAQTDVHIYGPGLLIFVAKTSFAGDITFFLGLTPLDANSSKLTLNTYSSIWFGWFAKFCAATFLVNIARDKLIWDFKQPRKNPLIVKEEKNFKDAKTWYGRFFSANSITFEEARNSMEW